MGNKFAVTRSMVYTVEVFAYGMHSFGVANGNDGIGQFFGPEIKVVNGSAAIDNEFTFCDPVHNCNG